MSLRIFGSDPDAQPKVHKRFSDDIVGRFRSGHQLQNRPVALTKWRVTTGDPEVADAVHQLLGGEAPQSWAAKGEDNLEVFTDAKTVPILLVGDEPIRQAMVLWSRNGKLISKSDGETMSDGSPDPDRDLTYAERKKKANDGIGPVPQIEVYFRLAGDPDLGIFKFQTGSWSMVRDLVTDDTEREFADRKGDLDGADVPATLTLEKVEFVAKSGERAGQVVTYTKPVLKVTA